MLPPTPQIQWQRNTQVTGAETQGQPGVPSPPETWSWLTAPPAFQVTMLCFESTAVISSGVISAPRWCFASSAPASIENESTGGRGKRGGGVNNNRPMCLQTRKKIKIKNEIKLSYQRWSAPVGR